MGLLDKLRPKEERLHIDPETKETRWIPVEKEKKYVEIKDERGGSVRVRRDSPELTREEQFPAKRQQPWQTPRGKRVIKSIGGGVKRIDKAVVDYNRTRNIMGRQPTRRQPTRRQPKQSISSYSTQDNYNPFGRMFDTGMNRPTSHKKKSKAKYTVIGGKAYPIAGTGKKKKGKKSSRRKQSSKGWDTFNAFGGYKF